MGRQQNKETFRSVVIRGWSNRWLQFWAITSGLLALLWLILRSGNKPNRLTYPCQQAAISSVSITLGIPLAAILIEFKRRLLVSCRCPQTYFVICLCFVIVFSFGGSLVPIACESGSSSDNGGDDDGGDTPDPPAGYQAAVYHVTTCAEDPVGVRFAGLERLLQLLGAKGHKFYNSAQQSSVSGPDGIVGSHDVIIIKINYQWPERGGTNTDLLRGLILSIIAHPDTFTGEIVVCENTQSVSSLNFNRARNNAKDQHQSPRDVVDDFQSQGYSISLSDWRQFRRTQVNEYSEGDMDNGYVVYAQNTDINGRVSYPKFQTGFGTFISVRDGVWDNPTASYDRSRLKFLNVPVLKGHSVYGTTSAVKHYMGVVTDSLSSRSHDAIQYGGLGAVLAEIQLADLNILDAIWVGAIPDHHPSFGYDESLRRDMLLASFDPIALDYWAVKNILLPAFEANGYPGPYPSADPDDENSIFREYLDNSMAQLLIAGYEVTNNPEQIIDVAWSNGDFQGDGNINLDDFNLFSECFTGAGGGPLDYHCLAADFDCDYDVDCDDWQQFSNAWTDSSAIPEFDPCE